MNRFVKKKKIGIKINFMKISIVIFLAIIIVFLYAVINLNSSTITRQENALKTAIDRDVVNCYALEGFYPPSLDYMEDHYGLTYNKDLFFVDYQPVGSNLLPNITIIRKGAANEPKIGK